MQQQLTKADDTSRIGGVLMSAAFLALADDADNAALRTTLGLGSMAIQVSSNVNITGGTLDGCTLTGIANPSTVRSDLGLGTAAILASDTDGTLAANSDSRLATQKAVRTYVDAAVVGLLDLKGSTNASSNPNYPSALKGDCYVVSNAGKVGGASGKTVDVGDMYVATADNVGGTEASVGTSWVVLEHNLPALGSMSTQDSSNINVTGGTLDGVTITGIANPATVRSDLGLGTMAVQAASNYVAIAGATMTGLLTAPTITVSGAASPSQTAPLLVTNGNNADFTSIVRCMAPNTTGTKNVSIDIGVANSANNLISLCFQYVGSGSTSNAFALFFHSAGTAVLTITAAGVVTLAAPLPIASGGTGSGTVAGAKTALGIPDVIITFTSDPNASSAITTGDGKMQFRVPASLNGWDIVAVDAYVATVSSSGNPTFQIRRKRSGVDADVCQTRPVIDANENDSSTGTAAVVNTSNDDLATGDILFLDVDVAGTGTKGVSIPITVRKP